MPTRRLFLSGVVAAPVLLPNLGRSAELPEKLQLTPACGDEDDLTPSQTEGPFFTPQTPQKRDFASDAPNGERMTIGGYVLTPTCRPVATALVELWHADETGTYDTSGYRLRGHQFTDADGHWWFNTIVPGLYPGRTRHYHLKVQRPGGRVLTTQLYFPNEPRNERDGIFDGALVLDIARTDDGRFGRYDFVVA
ncbi:intradiol ring-cleavage dioxygenase [Pseudaminobacter arsenicus]|uniref:Intradiol ring-cleavage dioxygenase n=1 Tax=Borborobacter arsenicus TaxID=1851146 RepID=A0A432UZF2_9HYPH|nr:intradiol ring-cleavage dioxygenase [Pseudaminobacter arsenicus]RUM95317.1 intradiol ring-cleavage dioxygenase [Pseudaminobacter arsenicus]